MLKATLAQNLIEHLTTAILWFDDTLRLQIINPAAETLLEMSNKQAYRLELKALLPDDITIIQQVIIRRIPLIEHNKRINLTNGRTITVNCSITPINETNFTNHILIELTQVDQHLRITREENLISQQQALRNVIRGMAHEIKNPLGGLRGAAQLLERELPNDTLREYTRIIIGEADRLQTLLNRMLGSHTLNHKKYVNIHEILAHVQQLILSEWGDELAIECDFDPSIPELWADADQLLQAVLNIMQNSAQAVEGKGEIILSTRIHRRMTLGHHRYKLVVRVDIIDNGPGIPLKMTDQIFYPLVTGRPEGTGLGLPIAQSLINNHDGLIEFTSRPGKTVFTIWLPVTQKENYESKKARHYMGY